MLKKLLLVVTLLLVFTTLAGAGTGQGKRGSCKHCHNGTIPVVGAGLSCGGCHANPPATGAHRAHTDGSGAIYGSDANNSVLTYRFNCGNCHTIDPANHGNSLTDLELYNPAATGFKSKNPATAGRTGTGSATVCSNVYCHSAGQPAVVNSYAASPLWGGGFSGNSCAGCHSFPPNYTNNAPKANSHVPHNFSCNTCHAGTTADGATIYNASAHVNGSFNVTPGSGTAFTYVYAPTGGSCSSISCHGNTNATWGGTVECGVCHGNPPPSAAAGYTGVAEATSPHMKHAGKGANYSYACSQCHKGNTHGSGTYQDVFIDKNGIIAGPAATYTTGTRTCSAVNCHSDGTSLVTGLPVGGSVVWGSGKLGCSGCHGGPPAYANNSPKANSHLSPSHRVSCGSCHAGTTSDGTSITNLTRHVNGAYDLQPGSGVSFTYSFATAGGTCSNISCHGALSATWGGTATCLVCHSVVQGTRAAITSQFGANSHHVQGTLTDAHCYQCHWEANSDGSINSAYHHSSTPGAPIELVIYGAGTRPAAYVSGTTAIQYTSNGTRGEIEKINSHCLGCHSDQNNSTNPFGDGKTPKQYAWDGTSVAARYAQSGKTTWGKYATVPNAAQKNMDKSYSAHGNSADNKRGWNTTAGVDGTIANTSGTANVLCYDCHNSHGSAVSGVTTRYASATANGGILKTTVAGQGGYAVSYSSNPGGSVANKDQRNSGASLCLDCHQNQTAATTPWGFTSTYGATQPILGYWDSPFMSYSTSGPEQRFPFKKQNGTKGGHFGASMAMSSTPMGSIDGLCTPCHDPHGVSPTLGANQQYAVPLLKGTWVTSPYKEDVPPADNYWQTNYGGGGVQYHIDQNTFGSEIRGAVTGMTQTVDQSAGLCLGCHPKTTLTAAASPANPNPWKSKNRIHESVKGWKTSDGTVEHNYSCSKCHSAHTSSVLPRLMVTNCLDSKHKGRKGYNPAPVISGSSWGDDGSGSGRIPGSFNGSGYDGGPGDYSVACHESSAANGYGADGTNQAWNVVTPWIDSTPPSAPTGISATAGNMLAIISWTAGTGDYVTSLIRYGTISGVYTTTIDPATSPRVITGLANGTTYYYQVGAKNAAGTVWSGQYSVTPVLTLPSAPTGISATAGNAQTAISWTAGLGSTSSLIRYGTTSGNYTTTIDPATSPRVVNGLTNGTTYYYQVGAKNGAGITWSAENNVTPVLPLPSAPTGISGIAGNGQLTISWTAGANSTSSLIRYGTVYGTYTTTIDPATSPRVITGLVNGTNYYYQVGAKNATGITWSGVYARTPALPPPSAPTVISAIAGNAQATVSWTAGANSTSSLIRYGTVSGSYTTTFDPASSPRVLTGLVNGTTYYYQVGAKNAAGTIAWSAQYSVTPVAPPVAPPVMPPIPGNGQVTISWTAGTGSTSSLIRYGTTSGVYTTTIDPAISPRVITGLTNGTTIFYQVGAKNAAGTTWSPEYSVTPVLTPPSAPTGISAIADNAQATVSWTAGTGSTSSLIRYGTVSGTYTTTIDPATSPRVITGLTNGTAIYYQVAARNAAGITWSSEYSVTPNQVISGTVNFAIDHHVQMTERGFISVDYVDGVTGDAIVWAGPFDGMDVDRSLLSFDTSSLGAGVTITSARLYMDYQNSDYMEDAININVHESTWDLSAPDYNNIGTYLDYDTVYVGQGFGLTTFVISPNYINRVGPTKFALKAADEDYNSYYNADPGYSRVGSYLEIAYTIAVNPAPSAPTGISAVAGNAQATISWTAGTGSTSSVIRYGTTSGSYPNTIDPAVSPRTITGLTNGTLIYFQVGATNASGTTWSGQYSVTPVAPSVPPTLTSPTATAIGSTTATLGANVTSTGGAAITANGTCWGTTANPTANCVDQGSHVVGAFTQSRTGLTEGSLVYYRGYATNSAGTGYSSGGTMYTEPAQPTTPSYTNVGANGLTLNWATGSTGNADNVIVVMKSGSAVNSDPVDGTAYTANSAFGSGSQTGTANYVVYKGTGTSVAVTGLSPGTTYYVKVYAFAAGAGGTENYNLTSPLAGSQATSAGGGPPAAPALLWPNNGYSDQVGYPEGENLLQWSASPGATEYNCEIWSDDGGDSSSSGWTTALSYDPGDLPDNYTYSWRVRARNANSESDWSETWNWYDAW